MILSAVSSVGAQAFELSPAEQASHEEHLAHQHYAVADLKRPVHDCRPGVKTVMVGIDVDYYARDPEVLLGHGRPLILFSFNPMAVAGQDGDCWFRIENDEIIYTVGGGGNWRHRIWDWCAAGEFIEVNADIGWNPLVRLKSWLGFRRKFYYKVHHSRPWPDAPHRVLIWCLPIVSAWKIDWLPSDVNARLLRRVTFSDKHRKGWNSLVYSRDQELRINIGRAGEDATVDLLKADFDMLNGLTNSMSVTARMIGLGYKDTRDKAMFAQYHGDRTPDRPEPPRIVASVSPRVHWPASCEADEPESSYRQYSSPLIDTENRVPMLKRWETLSQSIDERVSFHINRKMPGTAFARYAGEFVAMVVPEAGVGVPYDLETTASMLSKPSQTLAIKQIWESVDMEYRPLIEAFTKNEPVRKAGRVISSFPDMRYLLGLSKFTLAFRDRVLHAEHNEHWFCPGLTPTEIANKVRWYCSDVHEPMEGDFSNFDGSVSEWAQRHVMSAVYHRYFGDDDQAELRGYTDMLISCPARAKKFHFQYEAGPGVKSGSPTTCDLNTVYNAFIQYVAVRRTLPELAKEDAFQLIGLAFGDDSLFDRRFWRQFVNVASRLGMDLKIEPYAPENGVTFLARVFVEPTTTNTSFQDPLRTWRKLHLTARDPNVPLGDAAVDRVEGYLETDGLTPVTGAYCRAIVRNYTDLSDHRGLRKDCDREKPYWLTIGGAWPQDPKDIGLMFQVMASRTGFSIEVLRDLDKRLNTNCDVWQIPMLREECPGPSNLQTLDEEGGLADGEVDDRQIRKQRDVAESRAGQKSTGSDRQVDRQSVRPSRQDEGGLPSPGEGSSRASTVHPRSGRQGPKSDRGTAEQTRGSGGGRGTGNINPGPAKRRNPKVRSKY
jgi:hypothetical protein